MGGSHGGDVRAPFFMSPRARIAMRTLSSSSTSVSTLGGDSGEEGSDGGGESGMVGRLVCCPPSRMITGPAEARADVHERWISRVFFGTYRWLIQSFLYPVCAEWSSDPLLMSFISSHIAGLENPPEISITESSQLGKEGHVFQGRVVPMPKLCLLHYSYKLDYVNGH